MSGLVKFTGGSLDALREAASKQEKVVFKGVQEYLYIILDGSISMTDIEPTSHLTKWEAAKGAAQHLLAACDKSTRAGVIIFSEKATVLTRAVAPSAASEMLIAAKSPDQGTALYTAIEAAMELLDAELTTGAKIRRMICMTDGATMGEQQCIDLALKCATLGIIIDCVGFGVNDDTKAFMTMLATHAKGVYKGAENAAELVKQFKLLTAAARGLLTDGNSGGKSASTIIKL